MAEEIFDRTFDGLQKWMRHLKYMTGVAIAMGPGHPHLKHMREHLKYSIDALIAEVPHHPVDCKCQAHDLEVILIQAKHLQKWAAANMSATASKKVSAAAAATVASVHSRKKSNAAQGVAPAPPIPLPIPSPFA